MTLIALTVDVEGSWFDHPHQQRNFDINDVLQGLKILEAALSELEDELAIRIPVTWFIRCDDSVADTLGSAGGLLRQLESFIDRRTQKRDGFGLHPHFYDKSTFELEYMGATTQQQLEIFYRAYGAWRDFFQETPRLSRMGEAIMSSVLSDAIAESDIEIDASGLPGRVVQREGFQIDWQHTPLSPYTPSISDYRIAARTSADAQAYTQAPFTMVPIRTDYDKFPGQRYLNLSYLSHYLCPAIDKLSLVGGLITVIHPHELVSTTKKHALISYSVDCFKNNIRYLYRKFDAEFAELPAVARANIGIEHHAI